VFETVDEVLALQASPADWPRSLRGVFADREFGAQPAEIERQQNRQEVYDLRHDLDQVIADAIKRPQ
jgi:hypothetical protein